MANRLFQRLAYCSGCRVDVFLRRSSQSLQHRPTVQKQLKPTSEMRKTPGSYGIDKKPEYFAKDREKLKQTQEIEIATLYRGRVMQKIEKVDIVQFEIALQNDRSKEGFIDVVHNFRRKDKQNRGHLSFVYAAIKYIDQFGLQKDLDTYNELLEVFPKNKFVNRTLLDALWAKPHPQIDCALDLLTLMEDNYVRPDNLTYTILLEIFGRASLPVQKAQRIAYWFDKYRDINSYLLDEEDLEDKFKVCKYAMERITNDSENIKVYKSEESSSRESWLINFQKEKEENLPVESHPYNNEEHFLISSQNQEQKDFILSYDSSNSLYVEGPHNIWMNSIKEEYFILRTGALEIPNAETHEEETKVREGMILGVCMTNMPVRNALKMWMQYLQNDNLRIGDFNIIFNLEIQEDVIPVSQ